MEIKNYEAIRAQVAKIALSAAKLWQGSADLAELAKEDAHWLCDTLLNVLDESRDKDTAQPETTVEEWFEDAAPVVKDELARLRTSLAGALDESEAARAVADLYLQYKANAGYVRCIGCDCKSGHEDGCEVGAYEVSKGGRL